jgi:TPR repeat protein
MARIVRRFAKWLVALLVLGGVLWFATPYLFGAFIDLTCTTPPDGTCQTRMRDLGHLWSARGDIAKAQGWYSFAAGGGDPASMFHLAWTYGETYRAEMAADPPHVGPAKEAAARAVQWYDDAAQRGFAPAANNLGEIYALGLGVDADPEKAHALHMQAAEDGNPAGAANVAIDFTRGRGVMPDPATAAHWREIEPTMATPEDLDEPTFGRTLVDGKPLPSVTRDEIRAVAKAGGTVTLEP